MGLFELLLSIFGISLQSAGFTTEAIRYLKEKTSLEKLLGDMIDDAFKVQVARLQHYCTEGERPKFYKDDFVEALENMKLTSSRPEDLTSELLSPLGKNIIVPGPTKDDQFHEIYVSILDHALNDFFRKVSSFDGLSHQILMEQNHGIEQKIDKIQIDVEKVAEIISNISAQAKSIWPRKYNKLYDIAPPQEQIVGAKTFQNPFSLSKAEDFNHNYHKIAKLFQNTPEWDNIQSRTENVFIEGGRGTGKSMLLRRLTAQASVEAARISGHVNNFEDMEIDYYGVYVKLTRGYYTP